MKVALLQSRAGFYATPPSTSRIWPVMYEDASEAR